MSPSTPPARDPSHVFPPAQSPHPSPSTIEEEQTPSYPVSQQLRATHQHHKSSTFIALLKRSKVAIVALCWGAICITALIEDPSILPPLVDLGKGIVGAVCAGGLILGVIALGDAVEESGRVDVEGRWGGVWRWCLDCVGWASGEGNYVRGEAEGTIIFDEEGRSVFLQDEHLSSSPSRVTTPQRSEDARRTAERLALPAFTFPRAQHSDTTELNRPNTPLSQIPSNVPVRPFEDIQPLIPSPPFHQREDAHPSGLSSHPHIHQPIPRSLSDPNVSNLLDEHASGLLGPSPMPPRQSASRGWKHFTGTGFYEYRQKLEAVSEWSNPGSSRELGEVVRGRKVLEGENTASGGDSETMGI